MYRDYKRNEFSKNDFKIHSNLVNVNEIIAEHESNQNLDSLESLKKEKSNDKELKSNIIKSIIKKSNFRSEKLFNENLIFPKKMESSDETISYKGSSNKLINNNLTAIKQTPLRRNSIRDKTLKNLFNVNGDSLTFDFSLVIIFYKPLFY